MSIDCEIKMAAKNSKENNVKVVKKNGLTEEAMKFRKAYDIDSLPARLDHNGKKLKIKWKKPFDQIDYSQWLPLFVAGLTDSVHPYSILARKGVFELLDGATTAGALTIGRESSKDSAVVAHQNPLVLSLPYVVPALRSVLRASQVDRFVLGSKILQKIAETPGGGAALVKYYRQVLPPFLKWKNQNLNIGDSVDYCRCTVADMAEETLHILEKFGGPDALINIQYVIPTYLPLISK